MYCRTHGRYRCTDRLCVSRARGGSGLGVSRSGGYRSSYPDPSDNSGDIGINSEGNMTIGLGGGMVIDTEDGSLGFGGGGFSVDTDLGSNDSGGGDDW